MNKLLSRCAAVVLCIVSYPCFAGGNLVLNGDFETGDLSHWTVIGTPTTAWADVTTVFPHGGKYDAELYTFSGNPQPVVGLQQVLNRPTTPLTLTFWLKNDGGESNGEISVFDVLWDNARVFHLTSLDTDLSYHMYTVTLPLEPVEGGILQFDAIQNPTEWHLDDITAVPAVAVPEPSSTTLTLFGLVTLFAARSLSRRALNRQAWSGECP